MHFPFFRSSPDSALDKTVLVRLVLAAMIWIGVLGQIGISIAQAGSYSSDRSAVLPGLMLWAWERAEDLRFIDRRQAGVAFLSETCCLKGEVVLVRPRLQPLSVPSGTVLESVVRIECDRRERPVLSAGQKAELVRIVSEVSRGADVKAVQIDFDARESQRKFYRELLHELREVLPDSMPLSITALASWCMYDSWISGLPVDEVVPMLFRMGADRGRIRSFLKMREGFVFSGCGRSVGISVDEPGFEVPVGMRVYAFSPKSWSEEAYRSILRWERR